MKIIGTGLGGLVGSRIVQLLSDFEFQNISTSSGVDITNKEQVFSAISNSPASVVFHLAAKAHVDVCEQDKKEDLRILALSNESDRSKEWQEKKTAWAVNVIGTKHVIDACQKVKKKLIFVSTDFVFDGDAPPQKGYTEDISPCSVNWYGQTKLEAENLVKQATCPWTIMRIAYPFQAQGKKVDFVRIFKDRLQNKQAVAAVVDHIMTPTFLDDIAAAFNAIVQHNAQGIYHVVGSEFITPYESALLIAKEFNLDASLITQTTRAEFFKNRAPRPFHLKLNNDKITGLGVEMRSFEEGIKELKRQIISADGRK